MLRALDLESLRPMRTMPLAADRDPDSRKQWVVLEQWGFPFLLLAAHDGALTRLAPVDYPIRSCGVSVDWRETL
jgi:hypothetical protein